MSLFWRLLMGFALTALLTIGVVRYIVPAGQGLPTMARIAVSGGSLVQHQGEVAFRTQLTQGAQAAKGDLAPIEDSGLSVWLVSEFGVIGSPNPPENPLADARRVLRGGASEGLRLGYRVRMLKSGDHSAVLLLVLPGIGSPVEVVGRALVLVCVPVMICVAMARRMAQPLEKIQAATKRYARGDLSTRIGSITGPVEVTQLGEAFDQMASQLQITMETRERLLGDVAHEVRSPLARIRLASQMVVEGKGSATNHLVRIQSDVDRLNEIVESLLAILGPPSLVREEFDLASVVHGVVEAVGFEMQAKGIEFVVNSVPCSIAADPKRIWSAVENVVRNAAKHSSAGSRISISVSSGPAMIAVTDQGPGVSEEDLERIFLPFFRSSEARDRDSGGAGLGLAIVRRVAEELGGSAFAENDTGGGLRVTVRFGAD